MNIKSIRNQIPDKYKGLTDEEIMSLTHKLELLAEILIESHEYSGSKTNVGVIDSNKEEIENESRN